MASIQECIKEWMKVGYTDEQSKELDRLSRLGEESNNIVDVNLSSQSLIDAMKQFELNSDDKSRKIIEKLNEI